MYPRPKGGDTKKTAGNREGELDMLDILQAILPVAFAVILRMFGALSLVWVSFVGAEVVGVPVAVHLWREAQQNI